MKNIENFAEQACAELNCRLYHIERLGRSLKVYVDKEKNGVQLSECEKISKRIQLFLSAEGLHQWGLEVSSPGLDRKLIQPWHFSAVIGRKITFQYDSPEEKKRFSGHLTQVNDKGLILDGGRPFDFEWIKEARLVFQHSS